MYLRQLELLRLVVEEGSFAGAAARAGVSQPAISQAMRSLQGHFAVPLFQVDGKRRCPTPLAQALAREALEFEEKLTALRTGEPARSARRAAHDDPVLRIGMSPGAALLYAPALVQAWRRERGREAQVRIAGGSAPDLVARLRRGEIDLLIAPKPRRTSVIGVHTTVLFGSTPTIYARRGHPAAHARALDELHDVAWVIVGGGATPGGMVDEAYRVRHLEPAPIAAVCDDYRTMLQIVAHTDLMGVVPHPVLVDPALQAQLQPVRIREGLPRYEVCLFEPITDARNAAADTVRRALQSASAVASGV
jgi:LysR family transcriptional regulator, regulator of abg operon